MKKKADHSIKQKSVTAIKWSGIDILVRQGLQLIVTVVLARILTPEDFGTIALLYLFIGIATVFIDGGFSAALIQNQNVSHTDESTVFWINLLTGTIAAFLFWISAPWIASFYEVPNLVPIIEFLSINIIINAIGSIQMTLLTKSLDFKTLTKVGVLAKIFSGVVAIVMAVEGYGVWTLVFYTIVGSAVTTILLWVFCPWRPGFCFCLNSLRRLFSYGGYLMCTSLMAIVLSQIHLVIIGKMFGIRELGFYSRAENLKKIITDTLTNTFDRVAFPVFSSVSGDKEKFNRGVKTALQGMMLINVPLMLGVLVTADSLISLVIGDKWLPAVPILQILCIAGIFWPLHVVNLNALKALGHSRLFFRLEILKGIIGLIFIAIGVQFGVLGVAWSQVGFTVVAFFINSYYTGQFLNYGYFQQIKDFNAILTISIIIAGLLFIFESMVDFPPVLLLPLQVGFGLTLYIFVVWFFKVEAFEQMTSMIRKNKRA